MTKSSFIAIVLGTIGPAIVAWIGFREFKDQSWVPTYVVFSLFGLVWGGLAIYNNINHTALGSLPRAMGHVVTGINCGFLIVIVMRHRKSKKKELTAPPNQAL